MLLHWDSGEEEDEDSKDEDNSGSVTIFSWFKREISVKIMNDRHTDTGMSIYRQFECKCLE
jgi:hypothetical protein